MSSLRRHEGYLLIDHRDSPGVSPELARAAGAIPVGQSTLFETATITCSHCQTIVWLNPDRTRERGYCRKCDHYICDRCTTVMAATLECVPFAKVLDDAEKAARTIIPGV